MPRRLALILACLAMTVMPARAEIPQALFERGMQQGKACHNLAFVKLRPEYGTPDPQTASNLLAQNCLNRGFDASCQPCYDSYNASLSQSSGGAAYVIEDGILGIMSFAVDRLAALDAAGKYSIGSYGG